ncbi:hypothetical protein BUALT_Bualt01G0059000 [Buddleja alternifolia]|uniref:Prolamin-like domain-containing protein n=1 Tax=Buddleja alternifolia TaxID=168488 RepID=A0AAV6YCN0_9LAMI|nr:hypothetical protein BUALT_Bualt01G0059000 [Buddleja alternifolia]
MARSTILFALATAFLALAAFSVQARKSHTAAPPSSAVKKHPHHAPPHSVATTHPPGKEKPSHKKQPHHAPPHSRRNRHPLRHAAPPQSIVDERVALSPEPYAFADSCLAKLTDDCGAEIFRGILGNDGAGISKRCCVKLVAMGRRCRRWVLRAMLMLPELPRREKKEIRKRNAKVLNQCVAVRNALKFGDSPAPAPASSWWL